MVDESEFTSKDHRPYNGGLTKAFYLVTIKGRPGSYLYKEYSDNHGPLDWGALDAVVGWARTARPDLRERCALPQDVVHRGGQPVGVTMWPAAGQFYRTSKASGELRPNNADFLGRFVVSSPGLVWGCLGDLLTTTLMLHKQDVWVMDLHARNYLFDERVPRNKHHPITLVLDCDGFALHGKSVIDLQPDEYNWFTSDGSRPPPSRERDLYAFAVNAIRTLTGDHGLGKADAIAYAKGPLAEALDPHGDLFEKWLSGSPMLSEEVIRAEMLARTWRACRGPRVDRQPVKGGWKPVPRQAAPSTLANPAAQPSSPVLLPAPSVPASQTTLTPPANTEKSSVSPIVVFVAALVVVLLMTFLMVLLTS